MCVRYKTFTSQNFGTPSKRCAHPCAIFELTPSCNLLTIDSDMFSFKIVQDGKFFDPIIKTSSVVEGLFENEVNHAWSTTKVGLYHSHLIFKVIYNDIV